jgi:hypothetical protein
MWGKYQMQEESREKVKPWVEGDDPDEHAKNLERVRDSQCKYNLKSFF